LEKEIFVDGEQASAGIGGRAPDGELRDEHGAPVRLCELWQDRPVVLAFVRHFG
jgi:hypothetical protein